MLIFVHNLVSYSNIQYTLLNIIIKLTILISFSFRKTLTSFKMYFLISASMNKILKYFIIMEYNENVFDLY